MGAILSDMIYRSSSEDDGTNSAKTEACALSFVDRLVLNTFVRDEFSAYEESLTGDVAVGKPAR